MSVLDGGFPTSSANAIRQGLNETRLRFIATFVGQCDSIRLLVDEVAALGPGGPIAALTQVSHRLNGLAGTIGFPTVSARASDLEGLVSEARCGTFDARRAGDAVDAIRNAFATDLASPPVFWTPAAVAAAARARSVAAEKGAPGQRAIAPTSVEAVEHAPALRVLMVDDHAIVRRGLRALLSEEFHGAAFGEASDARQALEELRRQKWDVALLDMTLPGKSGLDFLKELKAEWPTLPVLVLSGHPEEQFALRVLKAGAAGYLTKESAPGELVRAIRKVLAGGRYVSPELAEKFALTFTQDLTRLPHETLSDREYAVMSRIGLGKTVSEIAEELSLSVKTISTYRARVLEKLGVKNNAAIVQYAIRNGLVS